MAVTKLLIAAAVIIIHFFANEDIATQTDWSGGDGILGPVSEWSNRFFKSTSINYISGVLQLEILPILEEHIPLIDAEFGLNIIPRWGDINADGYDDLLTVSKNYDNIYWYENPGDPAQSWTKHFIDTLNEIESIALVYLDDGTCSGFTVVHWDEELYAVECYYRYEPDEWYHWRVGYLGSCFGTGVTSADVDGDGEADIVGWMFGYDSVKIWWSCSPDQEELLFTPHCPTDVFAFDGDGDGDCELAVDRNWFPVTEVYWNLGTGWAKSTLPSLYHAVTIDAADVDGDGICEIIATAYNNLFLFWKDGGLWDVQMLPGTVARCRFTDLDEDGDPDIVGFAGSTFQLYYNFSQGSIWNRASISTGFEAHYMECADMNADTEADIIMTNVVSGFVRWFDHISYTFEIEGYLESSILDTEYYPIWHAIDWIAEAPTGTSSVVFQVRAADDSANMGEWSDTLVSPGSLESIISDGDQYFQYKAILQTGNPYITPTLEEVTVTWMNPVGVEEESSSIFPENYFLFISPNPVRRMANIGFGTPEIAVVKLFVYDVTGRLIEQISSREYSPGVHEAQIDELTPGIYFCRMVSGDFLATQRFVVIE